MFNPLIPDFVMVTPTTNELGKLLASYLSTSNDALAINFRKHYAPTISATLLQKTKTKRINAAVTEATFIYRHAPKYASRIVTLYQHLLKAKWIAPDTNPDDFLAIFSGEDTTVRVKWIAKPSYLYGLIRRAIEQELISVPSNGKIWQITESHFVDNHSRPFNDLHKQKESKTAIPTIEALLQILEPSA